MSCLASILNIYKKNRYVTTVKIKKCMVLISVINKSVLLSISNELYVKFNVLFELQSFLRVFFVFFVKLLIDQCAQFFANLSWNFLAITTHIHCRIIRQGIRQVFRLFEWQSVAEFFTSKLIRVNYAIIVY